MVQISWMHSIGQESKLQRQNLGKLSKFNFTSKNCAHCCTSRDKKVGHLSKSTLKIKQKKSTSLYLIYKKEQVNRRLNQIEL
jgi:hypothetical protein